MKLTAPSGMRDLLPPQAKEQRNLIQTILQVFEEHGYELVRTPSFEYADVIERGIETAGRKDLLRFVEPETGEIALFRPDITPQIARLVASHGSPRNAPNAPWRLCYEGTVVRRTAGRTRKHREITQVGIENIGLESPEADIEILSLAKEACGQVGLKAIRIELGHVQIGKRLLHEVPAEVQSEVAEALFKKDRAQLEALLEQHRVAPTLKKSLSQLVELYGDVDVLERAAHMFRDAESQKALHRLKRIAKALERSDSEVSVGIDLAELRGWGYYTGVCFSILANGAGQPIAEGGRYDELMQRFGPKAPATGFAIDVDVLQSALAQKE